jgi:hypothetical protein
MAKKCHSQVLGTYHKGIELQENQEGIFQHMKRLPVFLFFFVLAVVIGGVGVLSTWDIPAPVSPIEKVLPDERFPR